MNLNIKQIFCSPEIILIENPFENEILKKTFPRVQFKFSNLRNICQILDSVQTK